MKLTEAEIDSLLSDLRALVGDWQANGNIRPLGDPTAATWHKTALQLLTVLDGRGTP